VTATETIGVDGGTVMVSVRDIVKRPEWQMRGALIKALVKKYRGIYKADSYMPPIELADIKGALVLVSGWHRLAAQVELGRQEVDATVKKMTAREAHWRAAQANLDHGEPYGKPGLRKAFTAFIETRQYKKPDGKPMSYREMATAFSGGPSYGTLRNWVEKDHPVLFKALGKHQGGEFSLDGMEAIEKQTEEQASMERFKTALAVAVAESRGIGDPRARTKLDAAMTKAHEAIRKHTPYRVVKVEPQSDF
jgi:hypothetical protein